MQTAPPVSQWKIVSFDWDGTLADSRRVAYECSSHIFATYGLPPPPEETYLREITDGCLAYYQRHGVPKEATTDELDAIWQPRFVKNMHRVPLRSGAREVLSACRRLGLRVVVTSAQTEGVVREAVAHFKLSEFFDSVVASTEGKEKMLTDLAARFGISPREVIHIEDIAEDVRAAKRSGVTTVGIGGGFSKKDVMLAAEPDYFIGSLQDLVPILTSGA